MSQNQEYDHYVIEELKGVDTVELNFTKDSRVRVLFGSNGVGKTKVLEALFQSELFVNKIIHDNTLKNLNNLLISKKINYLNNYSFNFNKKNVYFGNNRGTSNIIHEPTSYPLKDSPCIFLGAKNRSDVDNKNITSLARLGIFSERRKQYFEYIFNKMVNDFKSLGMSEEVQSWFVTRAQSSNPYQKQSDNRKIEIDEVIKTLHKIDNRFESDIHKAIQIDGNNTVSLMVNQVLTQLTYLSSGFTSLLKIIQGIISGYANFTNEVNLTHVKGVVFIDEIESHLHPEWQVKIIPLLKDIFPNTIFYVATHSPLVLSQLQEGEAYLLKREDDGVVRSSMIKKPDNRLISDLINEGFTVDLNLKKIEQLEKDDQAELRDKMRQFRENRSAIK